MGSTGMSLGK